jgi:hypothetical protein
MTVINQSKSERSSFFKISMSHGQQKALPKTKDLATEQINKSEK